MLLLLAPGAFESDGGPEDDKDPTVLAGATGEGAWKGKGGEAIWVVSISIAVDMDGVSTSLGPGKIIADWMLLIGRNGGG